MWEVNGLEVQIRLYQFGLCEIKCQINWGKKKFLQKILTGGFFFDLLPKQETYFVEYFWIHVEFSKEKKKSNK